MNTLTSKESFRLKLLEDTIKKGAYTFIEVGNALMEIRDKLLWREGYESFDDYCSKKWGWGRTRAQQLMGAAVVVKGLMPKNVTMVTNERVAREVAKAPKESRDAVVEKAAAVAKERGKPLNAEIVNEARLTPSQLNGKHEPKAVKDDTGFDVPEKALAYWERRFEVVQIIEAVQEVRKNMMKYHEDEDLLFFGRGKLNQTFITQLEDIIRHLKSVLPHAVCPYCQGKLVENCTYCNKTGIIDRNRFNAAPKELLDIREKTIKKGGK